MSVQNADRLIRFMKDDKDLQKKVLQSGPENFEAVTAEAGASCTAYDLVCAVAKALD